MNTWAAFILFGAVVPLVTATWIVPTALDGFRDRTQTLARDARIRFDDSKSEEQRTDDLLDKYESRRKGQKEARKRQKAAADARGARVSGPSLVHLLFMCSA